MRPHQILENIAQMESFPAEIKREFRLHESDQRLWEIVKHNLAGATTFDFRGTEYATEHAEFGIKLFAAGSFVLPDQAVFYDLWDKFAVLSWVTDGGSIVAVPIADVWPNERDTLLVPTLMSVYDEGAFSAGALFGDANSVKENMYEEASRAMSAAFGATCLMMGKDVTARTDPAPAKLNARRAKDGKLPIGVVKTIRFRPEIKRPTRLGGTHASPCLHFRRGHFATLYRGTDRERVIAKPPTVVGANGESRQALKKDYFVLASDAGTSR